MKIVENKTSKKRLIYFIIIVVLFIILLMMFSIDLFRGSNSKKAKGKQIAVVNGVTVYEGDIRDRLVSITGNYNVKAEDLPQEVLKAMVLEVVVNNQIDKEAKKLNYQNDGEIRQNVESYKKGLMREKYLNDKIYLKIRDSDVRNEYDKLVSNLKNKEERKIKHILVESEDEIERVRRNVLRTGNFEKVAKEKSIDTASGENGGDIGYVLKEELVPEFADVAFILKVGEVSKPVHTQYGWHIIKIEDIRSAQFLPFDEVKDSIKQRLQQEAIQNYLLSLTKNSDVNFKIDTKKASEMNYGFNDNLNNNQKESIAE